MSCAAMRHRTAATIGWSRFETARAIERAMTGAPAKVSDSLTQGRRQDGGGRP